MSMGIAFSIKAALGISPVSSLPYVTSNISGMTVGETTIIINCGFVLLQAVILKRFQDLQPSADTCVRIFGLMIDVCGSILSGSCRRHTGSSGPCALPA